MNNTAPRVAGTATPTNVSPSWPVRTIDPAINTSPQIEMASSFHDDRAGFTLAALRAIGRAASSAPASSCQKRVNGR